MALLVAGLAGFAAVPQARADDDPPGRVGRVSEVRGEAWMWDAQSGEWVALQRNRPVTGGDQIQVERGGRAELNIGSSTVRIDGGTTLEVRRLDDRRIDFFLSDGSLALRVRSNDVADEIEVGTPEGRFLPRRRGHYRIDRDQDTSFATAWHGDLRFETHDSALAVTPGRRMEFWQEGPARTTHYSWAEIEQDRFSAWVARADREDERYANARHVSPEMTGWEDLDRHGRWDTHPEYGALWIPTTVVEGWAPYRYGHWSYISPWGWTWVDDAPWGFAPFHYGRWVYWRSTWCWTPGPRVARPVYAPALVAWVGGPQVSVSISIGSAPGPAVGWVPLAPREVYWPAHQYSRVYLRNVNGAHWRGEPPQYRQPGTVANTTVVYTNSGVPGAVTAVSLGSFAHRAPVAPAAAPLAPAVVRQIFSQPGRVATVVPPAPRAMVVAPGTVAPRVPPRPGAVSTTPGVTAVQVGPQRSVVTPQVQVAPGQAPMPRPQVQPQVQAPAAPTQQIQSVPRIGDARAPDAARPSERVPRRQLPYTPSAPAPAGEQTMPRLPQVTAPVVVPPTVPARPGAAVPVPPQAPRQPVAPGQFRRPQEPQQERGEGRNEQRPGPRQMTN